MDALCDLRNQDIIIKTETHDMIIDAKLIKFNEDLKKGKKHIKLDYTLNYFAVLLHVFALCCKGLNGITEAQCKSFYPLR